MGMNQGCRYCTIPTGIYCSGMCIGTEMQLFRFDLNTDRFRAY